MTKGKYTDDDRLHYQNLIDDIRESKTNQWRISNYGLLAQAAVASVFQSVTKSLPDVDAVCWIWGLPALSIVICFVAIYLVWADWARIEQCRETIEAAPRPYTDPNTPPRRYRYWPILGLFFGAQFVGSVLSLIYMLAGT